jgi:hypothetical protein
MEERAAELLPVPYFHIVFTLPAALQHIAYTNKALIYDLLFKASAETMLTIAADPKHLGARIAITAVLHTWGSASCRRRASGTMTHHPHVHMIVPGGGLSADGVRWIAAKPNFLLPVLVLSRLFRRLMLEKLVDTHKVGKLTFFGDHAHLADAKAFDAFLAPLKKTKVVRLFQAAVRRAQGCVGIPIALHPPRRHLKPAADRSRRQQRHLQDQGLQDRGARPLQDHDARRGRVHSPLPTACLAQGLPPHPPLRPPRQRRSRREHRAGAPALGRAGTRSR